MKIDNSFAALPAPSRSPSADTAERGRKAAESSSAEPKDLQKKVAPEELLDKIKELTEGGAYSVRFEKSKKTDEIVVRVVDQESGEVIRQVPPDELLEVAERLNELRGVLLEHEA